MRASLQVAPLSFAKVHTESTGDGSATTDLDTNPYSQSHMTPPATPNGSQEDLSPQYLAPPVFHNFLRAFYPFNPSYAMSDTSVTLPLNEGDVILVHSIHTNGWADGTLLVSGARGWLPTNYCEAYEPDDMCSLLKALLNFWDLLRSTTVNDREIFGNQEFMKGIIAGVRFLLVSQRGGFGLFDHVEELMFSIGTDELLKPGILIHSAKRYPPQVPQVVALGTVIAGQVGQAATRITTASTNSRGRRQ